MIAAEMMSFDELVRTSEALEATFAEAIGIFTMRFAHLEGLLNWAIICLLETTEGRGRVTLAAIQSVSTKLDILAALVGGIKMEATVRTRFDECVTAMGELNTYRNRLLHNQWSGVTLGDVARWNKLWTETRGRKAKRRHASFTAEEIRGRAGECLDCGIRLMDAMKAHQAGCPLEQPQP